MPALFDFKGYDNFVLAEKIESILLTKLSMAKFLHDDQSLEGVPGMVKKIHTYTPSGSAEDLERGEGLSGWIDADYVEREYRVNRTQAGFRYYDDDMMTDPTLIDAKAQGLAEAMVNDFTQKAVEEFGKTSNQSPMTNWDLSDFADAIAKYTNEFEDQAGLMVVANIGLIPTFRKVLGDYLKYTEAYIRTGAVGEILGVPIYTSKAIPEGMAFLVTRDAVTAFMKKGTFIEQDRDIDVKLNRVIAAKYSLIALTDERKCIALGEQNAQATTITTFAAGAAVVAGAAPTGASVQVFVNEKPFGVPVIAAGNAYSVTGPENLESGDRVRVVAKLEGYLNGVAKEVVA